MKLSPPTPLAVTLRLLAVLCVALLNFAQVSSVFPLLSEGLVRDRHILGEATYAALLEMALLGDERDLPWAEQDHVVGVVESNSRIKRRNSHLGSEERPRSQEIKTEDEDLAAGVWWDCDSQDGGARGGTGHVLDDAQLIRNVLPLALILQNLPTMASSVQVRFAFFVEFTWETLYYGSFFQPYAGATQQMAA